MTFFYYEHIFLIIITISFIIVIIVPIGASDGAIGNIGGFYW